MGGVGFFWSLSGSRLAGFCCATSPVVAGAIRRKIVIVVNEAYSVGSPTANRVMFFDERATQKEPRPPQFPPPTAGVRVNVDTPDPPSVPTVPGRTLGANRLLSSLAARHVK